MILICYQYRNFDKDLVKGHIFSDAEFTKEGIQETLSIAERQEKDVLDEIIITSATKLDD